MSTIAHACSHPIEAHGADGKCTVTVNHFVGGSVFVRGGNNPVTIRNPPSVDYSYLCQCVIPQ